MEEDNTIAIRTYGCSIVVLLDDCTRWWCNGHGKEWVGVEDDGASGDGRLFFIVRGGGVMW